jgi:hypothetical protein
MFPPRVIGVQHVPLWNIAGPHTGNLRPGPFGDPVFSWPVVIANLRELSGCTAQRKAHMESEMKSQTAQVVVSETLGLAVRHLDHAQISVQSAIRLPHDGFPHSHFRARPCQQGSFRRFTKMSWA